MGRIGVKGKKPSITNKDDYLSSDKEKVHAQRKRGRPQKSPKDEHDEEENNEDTQELKSDAQVKENEEETENGKKSNTEDSKISNGFRQNRNRRKSKPRRAAEAVIDCI